MTTKILLVQDEAKLLELYDNSLSADGFDVITARTAAAAFQKALQFRPDVVLADVSLAGLGGFALTKRLASEPRTANIPVIMLSTAPEAEREKAGRTKQAVGDYIVEQASRPALKDKIRSVLRGAKLPRETREILGNSSLRLDVQARMVAVKGREVRLTRKEFYLLALFLRRPGLVLSVQRLLEDVWGYNAADYNDPRTIQTHISSLRRKLGAAFSRRVLSVSGIGYRFN